MRGQRRLGADVRCAHPESTRIIEGNLGSATPDPPEPITNGRDELRHLHMLVHMAHGSDGTDGRPARSWRNRMTRSSVGWAVGPLILGLVAMGLSWLWQESSWWSSALSNAGVAAILVAPLYWVTERLKASVEEEGRTTRRTVAAIESHVEQVEQNTKRRIDDLSAEVSSRLAAKRDREKGLIDSLRTTGGDDELEELLLTAHNMGWISPRYAPRVEIDPSRGLWLSVQSEPSQHFDGGLGHLSFQLLQDHEEVNNVWWHDENSRLEEMTLIEVLTEVGTMCRRKGFNNFIAGAFLAGFADLLTVALNAEPEGRPVVAQFRPDWVLTDQRLYKHTRPTYSVLYTRFDDPTIDWVQHMGGKLDTDVDSFEEAYGAAQLIFPPDKFGRHQASIWGN